MPPKRAFTHKSKVDVSNKLVGRKRSQQALISRFFAPPPSQLTEDAASASTKLSSVIDATAVESFSPEKNACLTPSDSPRSSSNSANISRPRKQRRCVVDSDDDSYEDENRHYPANQSGFNRSDKLVSVADPDASANLGVNSVKRASHPIGNIEENPDSSLLTPCTNFNFIAGNEAESRMTSLVPSNPSLAHVSGINGCESSQNMENPLQVFERQNARSIVGADIVVVPRDEKRRHRFESKIGRLEKNSFFLRRTGGSGGGGDDLASGSKGDHYSFGGSSGLSAVNGDSQDRQKGSLSSKVKYTPLEQQFVNVKSQNQDMVLLVECGYKYRFFGEDADVASRVCRIYSYFDHNFNTASVPTVRLSHHVTKLVQAGYKVGVVRQVETAALKRASDKSSGPFERKLCEVYSRGTLVADGNIDSRGAYGGGTDASSAAAFIVAIYEERSCDSVQVSSLGMGLAEQKTSMSRNSPRTALVAVDTGTGEIIFDVFDDDVMRSALETRLMSIEPVEVVADMQSLSKRSERTIAHYCQSYNARLEKLAADSLDQDVDCEFKGKSLKMQLLQYYGDKCAEYSGLISQCVSALFLYLSQFKLENCLRCLSAYRSFAESRQMLLDANVLRNFEIFHNSNDGGRHGSLLSLIDRTKSPFGSRRIKQWLAHPLTNAETIGERLDAVEVLSSIVDGKYEKSGGVKGSLSLEGCICELLDKISACPDLERGLGRISNRRCSASDFIGITRAFREIAFIVRRVKESLVNGKIALSKHEKVSLSSSSLLFRMVSAVPDVSEILQNFVFQRLNEQSLDQNDYSSLYNSTPAVSKIILETDDILGHEALFLENVRALRACCSEVASCEDGLQSLLERLRVERKCSSLEWKKVAQDEYLLEVANHLVSSVPRTWLVVNQTKTVKRYRPREVSTLLDLLEQARERRDEQASATWRVYLSFCSDMCVDLRKVVHFLAELDCLTSLAELALLPGYTKPAILDPRMYSAGVSAISARHPIAESLLNLTYVPNDVKLGLQEKSRPSALKEVSQRCMIITGPNMGGKSSYVRMTALIAILAQIGSYVPASSAKISPFDALFSRMGASDAIGKGMSTLMVELAETSKILAHATDRSLVILDELGRGTSTHDGTAIAFATLQHLIAHIPCVALFVTHFPLLAKLAEMYPSAVGVYSMDYAEDCTDSNLSENASNYGRRKITFLYKVKAGVAEHSYGLNVAELAGLPNSVIDMAAEKAVQYEGACQFRQTDRLFRQLHAALTSACDNEVVTFMRKNQRNQSCVGRMDCERARF